MAKPCRRGRPARQASSTRVSSSTRSGAQVTAAHQLDPVAVALDAVHRLAHLAHPPPLEREGGGVHHGLVADPERAQAELLVGGQVALGGGRDDHGPAPRLGQPEEVAQDGRELPGGPTGSAETTAVSRSVRYASTPPCAKKNALSSRSTNGASESERVGGDDRGGEPVLLGGVAIRGPSRAHQREQAGGPGDERHERQGVEGDRERVAGAQPPAAGGQSA